MAAVTLSVARNFYCYYETFTTYEYVLVRHLATVYEANCVACELQDTGIMFRRFHLQFWATPFGRLSNSRLEGKGGIVE